MTAENVITIILGIAALLGLAYVIFDKWNSNQTLENLTDALKEAKDNTQLVNLAHAMAVKVVPVETLAALMTAVAKGAEFAMALTPDEIDKVIAAGVDLTTAIAAGSPITATDVVKAITAPATTPNVTPPAAG